MGAEAVAGAMGAAREAAVSKLGLEIGGGEDEEKALSLSLPGAGAVIAVAGAERRRGATVSPGMELRRLSFSENSISERCWSSLSSLSMSTVSTVSTVSTASA